MFVKFAKRKWARRPLVSLDAVLVNNRWVKGKVKQEYLCYLASIRENRVDNIGFLIDFWRKVEQKLSLMKLTPEETRVVRKSIQNKIRKPNATEVREYLKLVKQRVQERLATEQNKG
jgi:hypothetical protein